MKAIRRQLGRIRGKIASQAQKLLGGKKREKRVFIDTFYEKIRPSTPNISREDAVIIITGFLVELRGMDRETRESIITDVGR